MKAVADPLVVNDPLMSSRPFALAAISARDESLIELGAWPSAHIAEEDCVFSALNFFNDTINTNLFDRAEQARILKTEYGPVQGEPALGDLVTLINGNNELFHACVYIADGFVFTKNGSNTAQPWILMKLSDMLTTYESLEKPRTIAYLRHKGPIMAMSR